MSTTQIELAIPTEEQMKAVAAEIEQHNDSWLRDELWRDGVIASRHTRNYPVMLVVEVDWRKVDATKAFWVIERSVNQKMPMFALVDSYSSKAKAEAERIRRKRNPKTASDCDARVIQRGSAPLRRSSQPYGVFVG